MNCLVMLALALAALLVTCLSAGGVAPPAPWPCAFTYQPLFCAKRLAGSVIQSRNHTSLPKCCALCTTNPSCKGWTLDNTGVSPAVCYLLARVGDPATGHSAKGCTSGAPPPPPPLPPGPPPPGAMSVLFIAVDDLRYVRAR